MGFAKLQGFHQLIELDRNDFRLARYAATDHQDNAKLSDCMGKDQDGSGQEPSASLRDRHGEKGVQGRCAQGGGHLHRSVPHGFKAIADRLDREGEGIDDRTDQEAGEGEGEGLDAKRLEQFHQRTARGEQQEQIETQDGRGQNDGQGHDGSDDLFPPDLLPRQPPGQRCR